MKLFHRIITVFIIGLMPVICFGQIREIPIYNLPDVAMAGYDQLGPVIYYNPSVVQQVGPVLSGFFKAHEYGHIYLNHTQREMFEANPYNRAWVRQEYEKAADCYAARNVQPQVAQAAIQFFSTMQGPTRPDWYHPTGYERSAVIQNCMNH